MFAPSARRRGVTLIELMVLSVLLSFLFALLLLATVRTREAAQRAQSQNNLKQIALAMWNCNDAYRRLPPGVGYFPWNGKGARPASFPAPHGTLFHFLLPFVEQGQVYQNTADYSWTSEAVILVYVSPQDPTLPEGNRVETFGLRRGGVSYGLNWLVFGNTDGGSARLPAAILDGTSNTIVFAERFAVCQGYGHIWGEDGQGCGATGNAYSPCVYTPYIKDGAPNYLRRPDFGATRENCDALNYQAFSPAGILIALADGSTRIVAPRISAQTWVSALTPNGGEVLGADW
jgi:type II secretory pathway pseudopilin PulG